MNETWAQVQPDAALTDAITAPNAPWARNTAWAAFETLADGDSRRKLEALGHLSASDLRGALCGSAILALAAPDSAAAETFLGLLPESRERVRVQSEILAKLASRASPPWRAGTFRRTKARGAAAVRRTAVVSRRRDDLTGAREVALLAS